MSRPIPISAKYVWTVWMMISVYLYKHSGCRWEMTFSKGEEGNSLSCSKAVSRAPPKIQWPRSLSKLAYGWGSTLQDSVGHKGNFSLSQFVLPFATIGDLRMMSLFRGRGGKKKTGNERRKAPPAPGLTSRRKNWPGKRIPTQLMQDRSLDFR